MTTAAERMTANPNGGPSAARLHLQPAPSRRTLLDGGWWPRTTDPTTELPQLIRALNQDHSPVRRVLLGPAGWDSHPLRISVAGRVRFVWYAAQPAGLLFALRSNGDRVDLLVVPPDTHPATARAAMALAAQPANTVHAPDILTAVTAAQPPSTAPVDETSWEAEGGHL
jgi:Family of unknown function (DUF5994)